jgi:glucokinase
VSATSFPDPGSSAFLAIEIGGTKLQIVTGDEHGHIHSRLRFEVCRAQGAAGIQRQIETTLRESLTTRSPIAIGVGFGGPVDWQTGQIARSHHIEGWSGFELAAWLHGLTGLAVKIDNDANVAALAEATRGAGAGSDPVFYVTLGSGVGGGLVVNRQIYHGARPGEAEIGHMRLDRQGTIVESRCSGWAVDAKIRDLINRKPSSMLKHLVGDERGGEARHLAAALQAGDPDARQILQETAEDLAFALSQVTHLFHPGIIVIGGGLALLGEPLRSAVAEALPRFVMEIFAPGPPVVLAALGEDAVPVGALVLASR